LSTLLLSILSVPITNNPPKDFISALDASVKSFPPSFISTPLPEMLVVIITESFLPALAIISASFS
tara:strand:- start:636 stop:833 length:198 start_codon:yes stop_codon:yes gene_type:complete